uniref:Uncharacterized protein n=1 Tax=Lepeophtheirus salmonis TaxID=72036 RepID=A0A0K2UXN3_LEPSM
MKERIQTSIEKKAILSRRILKKDAIPIIFEGVQAILLKTSPAPRTTASSSGTRFQNERNRHLKAEVTYFERNKITSLFDIKTKLILVVCCLILIL